MASQSAPSESNTAAYSDLPHTSTTASSSDISSGPGLNGSVQSVQDSLLSAKDRVVGGPVVENVKDQAAKTSTEFQNLADSRTTPAQPAATGQPLTHYHSLFYSLLSWENPRATSIAFTSNILLIVAARYFPLLKIAFKVSYVVLGVIAATEIAGKLVFDNGFASRMRPRRYYTIPRELLESTLDDVEQLLNFFVIEAQRILFAENVYTTVAVFFSAFVSYWLIKILPFWGLSLLGTSVLYLLPLIYVSNRQAIDDILNHTSSVVSTQAQQIRDLTAEQANKATGTVKSYADEYTNKAQGYIGSRRATSPAADNVTIKTEIEPVVKSEPEPTAPTTTNSASLKSNDLPNVPKNEPIQISSGGSTVSESTPLIPTQ